ncbi:bacteriophage spanin2 family protein [Chryseobacterium binzhouense]|uniref:bacteriophage spanin2 family protein n=1 Tax=Chryseobacterium binzhouense TaxID=2593646 RepID=UPI002897DD9D|nr:bacteriophage spanin2 family protein [Chryseobacterium binzhouense]
MKNIYKFLVLLILISLTSCKSVISNPGKLLQDNLIEIGKLYEIQEYNAKVYNVRISGVDNEHIYGVINKNASVTIKKSDIRQMKKWQTFNSVIVGALAIAAIIFIPI